MIRENTSYLSYLNEIPPLFRDKRMISAKNSTIKYKEKNNRKIKEVVDLSSCYGAVNFGHMNPRIWPFDNIDVDMSSFFYSEEASLFSDWIVRKLGLGNFKILFQIGGSFAVSAALAFALNSKRGLIGCLENSFHGLGIDSLGVTNVQKNYTFFNNHLSHSVKDSVRIIKSGEIIRDWEEFSCLIYEPVRGAYGYVPNDFAWLRELEAEAKKAFVLTIADEIQSGYYRHGALSFALANDLKPDIMLFSKSMTNGLFPLSIMVYKAELEVFWDQENALTHTFQNSALGVACAWNVAQYIDSSDCEGQCNTIEKLLKEFFLEISSLPIIKEIFITGPSLSLRLSDFVADKVQEKCFSEDLLILKGGDKNDRLRIAPPITIELDLLYNSILKLIAILKHFS